MSGLRAEAYAPAMAAAWDRVVEAAPGGTVMQTRRFLDYHGDRFRDLGMIVWRRATPVAVFPLAAHPVQRDLAVSHPGTSFGGVLTLSRDPAEARWVLRTAARALAAQGFRRLSYRTAPSAVLRLPDDGLLPDLLSLGQVTQLDLCSVLPLQGAGKHRLYWQSEIRRAERKGLRADPVETPDQWAELHAILSARLAGKYGKRLVHSVAELQDLHRRLGRQSRAHLIRGAEGQALAGQWFIDYGTGTLHNQYNGASDAGLALGAASYGLALTLEAARDEGFRCFSFGRSTNDDGWTENRALLRFKSGFGAGLSAQYAIELPLDALAALRD